MTAQAITDADPPLQRPDVWDAQRLASLLADVGEAGLRDILRLFMADLPYLRQRLVDACVAGEEGAALAVLAMVQDSAEALGLAALATLARSLSVTPLAPANAELIGEEAGRVRYVPSLQKAS